VEEVLSWTIWIREYTPSEKLVWQEVKEGYENLHAAPRNARSMNPDEKISQNDLLVSHGLLTVANW
jgi:hypothetical protein